MDSNYVFLCGVMWCQYGQQEAGSELMRATQYGDPDLSALALAMLQEGRKSLPARGKLGSERLISATA